MSVQDIIYITPVEFKSCKRNTNVCNKVVDLYAKLLQGYDCFTKPDLVHLKFPTVQRSTKMDVASIHCGHKQHHKHHSSHLSSSDKGLYTQVHKGHTQHNFHSTKFNIHHYHQPCNTKRPQLKALSEAQTDTESVLRRQLKGFLNVINKNNFNKVFNKVKPLIVDENIPIIAEVILDTACNQVFYFEIFYNMLMDVMNLATDAGKVLIQEHMKAFVNSFIGDEQYLYKGIESENKYHEFCLLQKHKCLATSRNLVVVELIKNMHCSDWSIQSYCDNLLSTIANIDYRLDSRNTESNIDIIISMIKDLKAREPYVKITQTHIANLRTLLNNSQRLKFAVDDIAKQ